MKLLVVIREKMSKQKQIKFKHQDDLTSKDEQASERDNKTPSIQSSQPSKSEIVCTEEKKNLKESSKNEKIPNDEHKSPTKDVETPEKIYKHPNKDVAIISASGSKKAVKAPTKEKKAKSTNKKVRTVQNRERSDKKQTTLTQHFQVRRSERKVKSVSKDEAKTTMEEIILSGKEDGLEIRVLEDKGRGIFSITGLQKGDLVCEYAGDLIDYTEAKRREEEYEKNSELGCYMYYFKFKSKRYCVDATKESGRLGRLLNHSKTNSNVCTKLYPINNVPYLILVASRNISPNEELLYDYGDRSKGSLDSHPWLKA